MFTWLRRKVLVRVISRTSDPQRLYQYAVNDSDSYIKVLAVKRIEDEDLLYSVLDSAIWGTWGVHMELASVCLSKIQDDDKLSQLEAIDNHGLQIALCQAKGHRPQRCVCRRCGAELNHRFGLDNVCEGCGGVLTVVTTVERVSPTCTGCSMGSGYGCTGNPDTCMNFVDWNQT